MAKKVPSRPDPKAALENLERPTLQWKVILQIVGAFAILWLVAFMLVPYIDYWGVGVAGVLTLVALGFGIYVWRLTRKSAAIVDILKGATDTEGKRQALAQLEAKGNDALSALARSQLVAQEDPAEAMAILEAIDLKKAPAVVQDDVRANLSLLYLLHNRLADARPLVDAIRLDRQTQPKARAMYAAVLAETYARSGRSDEAQKLLETYNPNDPDYGEVRTMLLRAQVYTYSALKKRGLARKAMQAMAQLDPNMVAGYMKKGSPPELNKMAKDVLSQAGVMPKPKMRMKMR